MILGRASMLLKYKRRTHHCLNMRVKHREIDTTSPCLNPTWDHPSNKLNLLLVSMNHISRLKSILTNKVDKITIHLCP